MSDDIDEIWALYADDGAQSLDTVEAALLKLRKDATNREAIAELFRAMHTFKGNSRLLGLEQIESCAHIAEDLVGLVRDEGVEFDVELLEMLLEASDRLREMMEMAVTTRRDVEELISEFDYRPNEREISEAESSSGGWRGADPARAGPGGRSFGGNCRGKPPGRK